MSDADPKAKRRGRPPSAEPRSSWVSTKLPTRQHDRLIQVANQRGESVSQVIRTVLQRALDRRTT